MDKITAVTEADMKAQQPLTFGEKAVGMTFNPGGDVRVHDLKRACANLLDGLHTDHLASTNDEVARMTSLAITHIQEAQMWAVKALTWEK